MKTVNGLRYVAARWLAILAARARAGESLTWAERRYAMAAIRSLDTDGMYTPEVQAPHEVLAWALELRAAAGGR